MFEIRMQKRPFKKLLLKVGTSTSDLIHDYILDLEQGAMKYIVYQNECRVHLLSNENSNLKKDRSPVTLRIEPDYSKMPTLARERDDYIMSIKIDAHLHKVFGHEKKKEDILRLNLSQIRITEWTLVSLVEEGGIFLDDTFGLAKVTVFVFKCICRMIAFT